MTKKLNAFGDEIITETIPETPVSQTLEPETLVPETPVSETPEVEPTKVEPTKVEPTKVETQESTAPESPAQVSGTDTSGTDTSGTDTANITESSADRNFKAMRESKERLKKELAEERNKLEQYKAEIGKEPEASVSDGGPSTEDRVKMLYAQTQSLQAEIKLNKEYSDFDSVVTAENVEILKSLYPKIAYGLIQENNIYIKGKKAYEAMKKHNIFSEDPYANKKKKISDNTDKPVPTSSFKTGSSALGAATSFAEDSAESRRRIFNEMKRLAKGN